MQAVREMRHRYDEAAWSAETVISHFPLPEEEPDATRPHSIEAMLSDETTAADETAVTGAPTGRRGALTRTLQRLAARARPQIEKLSASAWFVTKQLARMPIVWAGLIVLFVLSALAAHSFGAVPDVSKTPVRVRVLAPVATIEEPAAEADAVTDAAVQDLELLAIQAILERRPDEAVRIYEALAAHEPSHVAYARAAELVARSAE